jgi:hypothetical protein
MNVMIRNIEIHNVLDIIQNSKFMEPNKCIHQKNYENICLSVSYDFKNLDGSKKIKV